jgi:hypothetical protein
VHNCVAKTQVSFDLSTLNSPKQAFAKAMLMDKEMIAINQVQYTPNPQIESKAAAVGVHSAYIAPDPNTR